MVPQRYMRLITILALLGLFSGQVMARHGRSGGGMRGSARGGSFRGRSGGAMRGSARGGSFRARSSGGGRSSARLGTSRASSFRRSGVRHSAGRRHSSSSGRNGHVRHNSGGSPRRSLNHNSGATHNRRFYHKSGGSHNKGLHHNSGTTHNRRFYHKSGTGRHSGVRHKSSASHHKGIHHKSSVGHRGGFHHGLSKGHHGHHRRHGRNFLFFSLPYYHYYGYPYYYYYSLPHYRYYYSYPYGYYPKPSSGYYYDYSPDTNAQGQAYGSPAPYTDAPDRTEQDEPQEPAEQGEEAVEYVEADQYLQDIADAFAARDYDKAARRATDGLSAQPDNPLLPFVHSQTLFAGGNYSEAARVLREALRNVDVQNQGVFYSLGFYPDQAVLNKQIDRLTEAVGAVPSRADLQLLLGYQLLGVGRYDDALNALRIAERNHVNKEAAGIMIDVLEKARAAGPAQTPDPTY